MQEFDGFIPLIWKMSKDAIALYNVLDSDQIMSDYAIEKVFLYEWFDEDKEVI